jgi:sugar-specific transcriptional regulator TrmB
MPTSLSLFLFKIVECNAIKDANGSSVEWMLKTLTSLGFTETEAHVYLYLTKEGPQKARDLAKALNLHKQRLYRSLRKMQSENIVQASSEYPSRFSAVPLDKVLDLFIKANIEEAKHVIQNKEELLSSWRTIIRKDSAGT